MIKVFQSVVCKDKGDCARATVASLLDLPLDGVPDFYQLHPHVHMNLQILQLMGSYGYDLTWIYSSLYGVEGLRKIAKYDGGIGGYFYATVPSQTIQGCTHAVVVDSDLNIVHDPNPNQRALELGPEDVISIVTVTDYMITGTNLDFNITKRDI